MSTPQPFALDLNHALNIASAAGFDNFNTPGSGLFQGRWFGPATCRNTISGGAYVTMSFLTGAALAPLEQTVTVWLLDGNTRPYEAEQKYFRFVRAAGGSVFEPLPLPQQDPRAEQMSARVMQDLSGRPSWLYIQPALSGRFTHIFPVEPERIVLAMDGSYVVKYDPMILEHNVRDAGRRV